MLLAIDVGNTQTVFGVYNGDSLVHMWRIRSNAEDTTDELRIKLAALLSGEGLMHEDITGVALASVVPAVTHNWEKVCERSFGIAPLVIDADVASNLVSIDLTEFGQLGADRVADAVAAKQLYGSPVIVVDFGTATNIEIIDADGKFAGGIIAPGVETSMKALFSRAALLMAVEIEDPGMPFGRSTQDAIKVGVVAGEAARVDGLVERAQEALGYKTAVVATGGLAHRIAPMSRAITDVNLELTLHGLLLIYKSYSE